MSGGARALWFEFSTREGYSYTVEAGSPDGADVAVSMMQDCSSDACDGFVNAVAGAGKETIVLVEPGFRPSVLFGVFLMDETSPAGVFVQVVREPVTVVDDVLEGDAEDVNQLPDAAGDDAVGVASNGCAAGAGNQAPTAYAIAFLLVLVAFCLARTRRLFKGFRN